MSRSVLSKLVFKHTVQQNTHILLAHPSAVGGRSPAAPWRLRPAPAAWGECPAGPRWWAENKRNDRRYHLKINLKETVQYFIHSFFNNKKKSKHMELSSGLQTKFWRTNLECISTIFMQSENVKCHQNQLKKFCITYWQEQIWHSASFKLFEELDDALKFSVHSSIQLQPCFHFIFQVRNHWQRYKKCSLAPDHIFRCKTFLKYGDFLSFCLTNDSFHCWSECQQRTHSYIKTYIIHEESIK